MIQHYKNNYGGNSLSVKNLGCHHYCAANEKNLDLG